MNKDYTELKAILKKYGITKKDIHVEMIGEQIKFVIIKREGIEQIEAQENMVIRYDTPPELQDPANGIYAVKAFGKMGNKEIESYGEASPENTTSVSGKYKLAVAEKRSLARVVLKLAGLYILGVKSEDEADEFKNKMAKTQKEQEKTTPKKDDGKTTEIASSS